MRKFCKNGHKMDKNNIYKYMIISPRTKNILDKSMCRMCRTKVNKKYNYKDYLIKYRKTEKGSLVSKTAVKNWKKRNPEKVKAQARLNHIVNKSKLEKKYCEVCGEKRVDGHHPDYTKPLEVIWLCRKHHKELHKKTK